MECLLGKWRLLKNEGFGDFLAFTKVSWYKRKIAEYSTIDINIKRVPSIECECYEKKINSTFYNNVEKIIFNDNYITSGTTRKKYSYENGSVLVDIIGSVVNWKEKIYYEEPNLIVEYIWEENGKPKFAKQIFKP